MAKSNIHNKDEFNFDEFQYSGVKLTPPVDPAKELAEDSLLTEPDPGETPVPEAVSEVGLPLEVEDPKAKKKAKKEKKVKEKKVKEKKIVPVAYGEDKRSEFLANLTEASPYTVLLGITLVALLLAVVFLFIELGRYDYDVKATKGKQSIAMNETITAPFAHERLTFRS